MDLFGDTGGGVTGSLSFDCGVFIVSSFFFSFLLLGAEGGAVFAVWGLLACCGFLGVEVSEVAIDEVSLSEMKTVFVLVPMVGGIGFAVVVFWAIMDYGVIHYGDDKWSFRFSFVCVCIFI